MHLQQDLGANYYNHWTVASNWTAQLDLSSMKVVCFIKKSFNKAKKSFTEGVSPCFKIKKFNYQSVIKLMILRWDFFPKSCLIFFLFDTLQLVSIQMKLSRQ